MSRYEKRLKEREEVKTHFFKRCESVVKCGYYISLILHSDVVQEFIKGMI
ncbi:hypothetical protein [Bacillus wiedmannii]|nr:hypothetical protein [Bacillus wiedmannii]